MHMNIIEKRYLVLISSIILYGFIWQGSTLSNFDNVFPLNIISSRDGSIINPSFKDSDNTITKTSFPKKHSELDKPAWAMKEKGFTPVEEDPIPNNLKEILSNYYEDSDIIQQEKAFKRVICWKEDFENIVKRYQYLDWKTLAAIIKAETQGKTGRQVSSAGADLL